MLSKPPEKPGRKEVDGVDITLTMSRASATTFETTTKTITNCSKNEKVPNIGCTIKEHEVLEEVGKDIGVNAN